MSPGSSEMVSLFILMRHVVINRLLGERDGDVVDVFFFFQAEDGIRDYKVTGVQTCALPISRERVILHGYNHIDVATAAGKQNGGAPEGVSTNLTKFVLEVVGAPGPSETLPQIGRASCRERV